MQSKRKSLASTSSSSGSLMHTKNSDVVRRGCLYVKRPPSNNPVKIRFKTWQKRYLVLRDMLTQDGDTLLELYNNETTANNSADGCNSGPIGGADQRGCSINLRNVIYVDAYSDSKSFPHAFIVMRTGKSPLIFGAKTDHEMREWMVAVKLMADKVARLCPSHHLTQDSTLTPSRQTAGFKRPPPRAETRSTLRRDDLVHRSTPLLLEGGSSKTNVKALRKSPNSSSRDSVQDRTSSESNSKYPVKVEETEDAALHQLDGKYYMIVNESEISLRQSMADVDGEVAISWPLKHIRKLKSESKTGGQGDLITLIASSRCDQSQGTYTFRITSGLDLIRRVRMFAKKLESNDGTCLRQQRDIEILKRAASSSLDKLLTSLQDGSSFEGGSGCQSMQSLVESSGSSSGSHLDQQDDPRASSSSRQSNMHFFKGNSYLPIIDDISDSAASNQPLTGSRSLTLSRSMGSIAILSASNRHTDSGFESSDEVLCSLSINPPVPPPRPIHTIGLN